MALLESRQDADDIDKTVLNNFRSIVVFDEPLLEGLIFLVQP